MAIILEARDLASGCKMCKSTEANKNVVLEAFQSALPDLGGVSENALPRGPPCPITH